MLGTRVGMWGEVVSQVLLGGEGVQGPRASGLWLCSPPPWLSPGRGQEPGYLAGGRGSAGIGGRHGPGGNSATAATQHWAEAALLYIEAPGTCPVPGRQRGPRGPAPPLPQKPATRQEIRSPWVGPARSRAPGGPGRDRETDGILGDTDQIRGPGTNGQGTSERIVVKKEMRTGTERERMSHSGRNKKRREDGGGESRADRDWYYDPTRPWVGGWPGEPWGTQSGALPLDGCPELPSTTASSCPSHEHSAALWQNLLERLS